MSQRKYITFPNISDFAPGLEIEVFYSGSNKRHPIQMMIDTGSAFTTLPLELLEIDLNIFPRETKTFRDFDNKKIQDVPIFTVNLVIEKNTYQNIDVLGSQNPHYGLLGRDILTRHIFRCDGPAQRFELEYQP